MSMLLYPKEHEIILPNASSTDDISSEDGTGAEAFASSSFAQRDFALEESDHLNLPRDADGESLQVQESTTSSSISPQRRSSNLNASPVISRDKKPNVYRRGCPKVL